METCAGRERQPRSRASNCCDYLPLTKRIFSARRDFKSLEQRGALLGKSEGQPHKQKMPKKLRRVREGARVSGIRPSAPLPSPLHEQKTRPGLMMETVAQN